MVRSTQPHKKADTARSVVRAMFFWPVMMKIVSLQIDSAGDWGLIITLYDKKYRSARKISLKTAYRPEDVALN